MLIREAKQEKIEANLALKRSAVNAVKDEEAQKFKEAEEEGQREIEKAEKGLSQAEEPTSTESKVKALKDENAIKKLKKEALNAEAIALKKGDMAKQAIETAVTKDEMKEAKEALKDAKREKKAAKMEFKSIEVEKEKRKEKEDLEAVDAHDAELQAIKKLKKYKEAVKESSDTGSEA